MKIRFNSYTPIRLGKGVSYSFSILPEFSVFWLNGLSNIYFAWLFWELSIYIKE